MEGPYSPPEQSSYSKLIHATTSKHALVFFSVYASKISFLNAIGLGGLPWAIACGAQGCWKASRLCLFVLPVYSCVHFPFYGIITKSNPDSFEHHFQYPLLCLAERLASASIVFCCKRVLYVAKEILELRSLASDAACSGSKVKIIMC